MGLLKFKLGRLHQCTFEQALQLRNRGFEGYYSNMTTTMEQLLNDFALNGIRPELSVVASVDDQPVGFVFIAVKMVHGMKLAWNGGTGVFPEYRGKGIAKAMMKEAQQIIREEKVDRALLEVVTINKFAISAYEFSGFRIADQLVGLSQFGPLQQPFYPHALPDGIRLTYGRAVDAAALPFYRDKAAWSSLWPNISNGESLIVSDASGQAMGYALFERNYEASGQIQTISLYQCEVDLALDNKADVIRILLQNVYGQYDISCSRKTVNLSTAQPELVPILQQADFKTDYEQYLMILEQPIQE